MKKHPMMFIPTVMNAASKGIFVHLLQGHGVFEPQKARISLDCKISTAFGESGIPPSGDVSPHTHVIIDCIPSSA